MRSLTQLVTRRHALSLFGCATAAIAMRPRPAAALDTVHITGLMTEALCPLFYGIRSGDFERHGVDVEYLASNGGAAAMAATVAGSYDVSSVNMLSICSAHLRGIPIVVVAPQVLYTTRTREAMLQVNVNENIRGGADFNGKTFGVPTLEGINVLAAKAWVDKNGGDSSTLKFVEIPNAAQPQAIAQRRIDAAIIEPPVLNESLADGTSKTVGDPMGAIGNTYLIAAYIARADWASQHADTLRRFTRCLSESAKYVNAHLAETAPLVSDFTKIELSVVAKMQRTLAGVTLDPAQTQPLIDAAAKYGFIARGFPAHELFWSGATA